MTNMNTNSNNTVIQMKNTLSEGEVDKEMMNMNFLLLGSLKVESDKEKSEQTCQSDSRTLTSSAFSEKNDDEDKIIKDASEMLEKEFLSKKRRRKIKKKCK
jgi:hypothetical protein